MKRPSNQTVSPIFAILIQASFALLTTTFLSTAALAYDPCDYTACNKAPTIPTDFQAKLDSTNSAVALLNWTAATDDVGVTAYKIYRNGSGNLLTTLSGNVISFSDSTLSLGVVYTYFVIACDVENACSEPSAAAVVTPTASTPSTATATATGNIASLTITSSITPASNDLNKQGSVFVAAILPTSLGGGVYFLNSSSAWTLYSSCASTPAYYTGNITSFSDMPIIKNMDLTTVIGTEIYIGYGVGGALSPAGTACTNMLNNGSYYKAYTIK